MEVLHKNNSDKGKFYVLVDGVEQAEMTYVWAGTDKFIIDHTEVDTSLAGKGVGKQLVAASVDFARKQNVRIIPLCPFAKKVFDKTPDWADVLAYLYT